MGNDNYNYMRELKIDKVVLSCGGVKDVLEREVKLLKKISKKNPSVRKSMKRIPSFGVRPKLEVGCMVTLRGNEAISLLKKLLAAVDNKLKKNQISNNHFSFGIHEYIEIPGEEYEREIGMMGFNVTVSFSRKGKRISVRKIKRKNLPHKQIVSRDEIIKFMEDKFGTKIK
ncbi:MAG: 50S ribosomal protein L5 [Candidatus Pacearchaeota archaeon]